MTVKSTKNVVKYFQNSAFEKYYQIIENQYFTLLKLFKKQNSVF